MAAIPRLRPLIALPSSVVSTNLRLSKLRWSSTHTQETSSDEIYPEEGFGVNWLKFLGIGVSFYALYEVNAWYTSQDGEKKSPIARLYEYSFNTAEKVKEGNKSVLQTSSKIASDRLLFRDAKRPNIPRIHYAESFDVGSPYCISPGSTADLSNLVIKTEYDEKNKK